MSFRTLKIVSLLALVSFSGLGLSGCIIAEERGGGYGRGYDRGYDRGSYGWRGSDRGGYDHGERHWR